MLTDANFKDAVKSGTVVVIMWMPGCPACGDVKAAMQEVAKEVPDTQFRLFNIKANPVVSKLLNIIEVPMLVLFKDGKLKGKAIVSPVPPKERLVEWVKFRATWDMPQPKEPCKFCTLVRSYLPRWLHAYLPQR